MSFTQWLVESAFDHWLRQAQAPYYSGIIRAFVIQKDAVPELAEGLTSKI